MLFILKSFSINMDEERKSGHGSRLSTTRVFLSGTLLAVVIAIPAVVVTFIMHYVLHTEFLITLASGILTLFVAMGFSYKIAKKLSIG
jgi:ABC-type protease/lipase transport system fused ATPase/permease subunit